MRYSAVLFLVFLFLPGATFAGTFKDGKAAYDRKDYQTALKLWQPLADQGNTHVMFLIGEMYERGNGVQKNNTEALKWFRKAADQGDTYAQEQLGRFYERGKGGVPQDYAEAYFWLSLSTSRAESHLTSEQKSTVEKRLQEWKLAHPAPMAVPQ